MKKILLISNYFHLKSEKEINRYRILAEMLSLNNDFEVEVVTSKFYQRTLQMRNIPEEEIKKLPFKFTTIYEPGYKKTISFRRLKSSRVFSKNVISYIKTIGSIDLIYQVVPTLDVASKVVRFANENNIPIIIDVQDLWPEAFRIAFDIPIISSLLFLPYKRKANYIYKNANEICSVSKTFLNRALSVNRNNIKGHFVYIGVDLAQVDKYCEGVRENDMEKLIIAYCGSLGNSYDLETVIIALSKIDTPIKLLVMGDGEKKDRLIQMARDYNVDAEFTGFINYELMCRNLRFANIVVNPIISKSTGSIINKHGDYVASGRPILNTQQCKEFMDLIDEYHMGLNSPSGDVNMLAKNILYLINNPDERKKMGINARKCAEEKFNREITYKEIIETIYSFFERKE